MSGGSSFPGVFGHAQAQRMLQRALSRGRLHHGLLLVGPAGIGRHRLAKGLAMALICDVAPGRGCGECSHCRRISEDRHTDVVTLRGEGKSQTIKVQAARDVISSTLQAPYESRAHVVIFDPADRMMDQAANALLKTFEEPRPGVHYILIVENPSDVIDTVVSRCTKIQLGPLDELDVRRVVDVELAARELSCDPGAIHTAVELADGRPGRALELATDPALGPLRVLLDEVVVAAERGPEAVFAGDDGPLWRSWKEAVRSALDPELVPVEEAPEVIAVKGGKSKAKTKTKAKAAPVWGTPVQQRRTLGRLTELWLMDLARRLRGRKGLSAAAAGPTQPRAIVGQIRVVQRLQSSIERNPNVRLALEQTLLEMHDAWQRR